MHWYSLTSPLITEFGYVLNSVFGDEIFSFYIFDNDEKTNLSKTLLAFQNYGAEFDSSILCELSKNIPGYEYYITFHLNRFGLLNLKV